MTAILPPARVAFTNRDGTPTQAFYSYLLQSGRDSSGSGDSLTQVTLDVATIAQRLGADDGKASSITSPVFQFQGFTSLYAAQDGNKVSFSLLNDAKAPGNRYCYGTDSTGLKGWQAVSDALAASSNVTLTVGTDGVTTFDLADLANSGTGASLVKITRDSKGRVSGTSSATTSDLAEGTNLYFTNARASSAAPVQSVNTKTGAVTLTASDVGAATTAQGAKADSAVQSIVAGTGITVDATDPHNPIVSAPGAGATIPAGYIDGLQMKWVSGTALTVTSGAAYIQSTGTVLAASSDIAKTGLSLTASTWYHVYLYSNAGTPDVEIVTTAPASPYNGTARSKTADTSRRYVGSVLTDSAAGIKKFYNHHKLNYVQYLTDVIPQTILNGGAATTSTSVSASAYVPATARIAKLLGFNNTSAYLFISNSEGPSVPSGYLAACAPGSTYLAFDCLLDSSQALVYAFNAAPGAGGGFLRVMGYQYER